MAYISDLAKELNRTEGMVIRMLKNRRYLKENGDPRKETVDAGLMREDGFIYKKGFEKFVKKLGMKKENKEEIGLGKKIILGTPSVEAFLCPFCKTTMLQSKALRQEKTNEFIFKCERCKKISKVTLNNISCAKCKKLVKADKAFLKKFCSKKCYDLFYKKFSLPSKSSNSPQTSNCLHCVKGYCMNDENRYYYDQKCPGDCDYYYRK